MKIFKEIKINIEKNKDFIYENMCITDKAINIIKDKLKTLNQFCISKLNDHGEDLNIIKQGISDLNDVDLLTPINSSINDAKINIIDEIRPLFNELDLINNNYDKINKYQ